MNDKIRQKNKGLNARDCAYIAVFIALVIAMQLALSVVPGVELVTVMFVAFSFAFGTKRGMIAATVFAILRQFVFGIVPTVLVLYLIYFNLLACVFGLLGGKVQPTVKNLVWLTLVACVCTMTFTMLDNILTPLWYGYTMSAMKVYFHASLPFMIPQILCTAVSVGVLFLPLTRIFKWINRF